MIEMKTLKGENFLICHGDMTPGENTESINKGDGLFSQYVYVAEGGATVTYGKITIDADAGMLHDFTHMYGKKLLIRNKDQRSIWFAINPIPETSRYDVRLISGPANVTIAPATYVRKVICGKGTAIVNDKELKYLDVGSCPVDKELIITLGEDCDLLIMHEV